MRGHIEWFEAVLHVTIGVYFQQQGFENASVNHFFPMPSEELRAELWRSMLPREWLGDDAEELIATAAQSELSGGSIANVVRKCAVQLINKPLNKVNKNVILTALNIEKNNLYSGVNCVRQCPLFCANGEYEIHKESRILLILLIWSPLISCNLDADYWRSSDLKIST